MRATLVMWGALGVLHRDALKPPAGVKVVLKLNFLSQKKRVLIQISSVGESFAVEQTRVQYKRLGSSPFFTVKLLNESLKLL